MDSGTRQALSNALSFGLSPYDPKKNKARDIGLGGPSTEYLATEYAPDGSVWNYPTIWWGKDGNPVLLSAEDAYNMAIEYEAATGKRFPRYNALGPAVFSAQNRSALGGADNGPITARNALAFAKY